MRAVVQRVTEASVSVDNDIVGSIKKGLLVFLGVGNEDNFNDLEYLVEKVLGLRIFEDDMEKMNLSLLDIQGELLIISQFTLYGDVRKGKRPNFTQSAKPDIAEDLYNQFVDKCKEKGIKTEKGVFGAHMKINLINDGPVTIMVDSKKVF